MGQIFRGVLFLSGLGSAFAALAAALRPVTRRYCSARWNYAMWLAVLLVLLPMQLDFPAVQQTAAPAAPRPAPQSAPPAAGPGAVAEGAVAPPARRPGAGLPWEALGRLWLLGAAGLCGAKLLAYGWAVRRLKREAVAVPCLALAAYTPRRVRVYQRKTAGPPLLLGLCRPMLFLPPSRCTAEQLHYILLHETTHLKQHDLAFRWLTLLARCVHWFNPVVHLVGRQIGQACEIACDQAVAAAMTEEEVRGYAHTILALLPREGAAGPALALGMAGAKQQMKRRMMMLKNRKRISRAAGRAASCLGCAVLAATLLAGGALAAALGVYEGAAPQVTRYGAALALDNQPFVEGGVLYVPLRETVGRFVDLSEGISTIAWEGDGTVEMHLFDKSSARTREDGRVVYAHLYYYQLRIGAAESYAGGRVDLPLSAPVALKGGVTYVPVDFLAAVQAESGLLPGFGWVE